MGERAQTTLDFAIGVSVFLLTVGFVFAFVQSFLVPFGTGPGGAEQARADSISSDLLSDLAQPGQPNHLDTSKTEQFFEDNPTSERLRANVSVSTVTRVNVSVESANGTVVTITDGGDELELAAGDPYEGRSTATTGRVVALDAGSCADEDETCRLVVRVW